MDFAVCSMSQGLSLAPTRPVRASCRPDMHLDRPPVAPASVPAPFKNRSPLLGTRSGIVAAIRIPLPRHEDDRDAPLTGAGWPINIPTRAPKSTPQNQSPTTIFSETQKTMTACQLRKLLADLPVRWLRLGIAIERLRPGRPQQTGRHERTPSPCL